MFKFTSYTNKLEMILENKIISQDAKNLLLSMLYKIETCYNDYEEVKRVVEPRKELLENILKIIDECNDIQILNPISAEGVTENINKDYEVDKVKMSVKFIQNEMIALFALYEFSNEKNVYIDEAHTAVRVSLPFILREGKDINKIEIIRDFDAWAWNPMGIKIKEPMSNLVYQNIQILFGYRFIQEWMTLGNAKNSLDILQAKLEEIYSKEDACEFLKLIYRLSILICIDKNATECERLKDELAWRNAELSRLENKEQMIEMLTLTKVENSKQIKKLDEILNNDEKILDEFERRNSKLSEYKKIFNVQDLIVTLRKERKKLVNGIDEANKMMEPKFYVENKQKLEEEIDLLNTINLKSHKGEYFLKLQLLFLKGLEILINRANEKKDIIDLMYILRYYKFIPYDKNKEVKDINELLNFVSTLENKVIEKLISLNLVNKLSKNNEFDKSILKKIFNLKTIDLKNLKVEFSQNEATFYDEDTIEERFDSNENQIDGIKYKKRIKLFC